MAAEWRYNMSLVAKIHRTLWIVVLFFLATGDATVSDEPVTVVDVGGIPGPYSFGKFCKTSDGVAWGVGGMGHILRLEVSVKAQDLRVGDVDWNGIFFATRDIGWVVGTAGTILHSTDSGVHWAKQSSNVTEDLQGVACIDQERCWVVGNAGVILRTEDGGTRWELLSTRANETLYAIEFLDMRRGWAVGEDGIFLSTSDSGRSWLQTKVQVPLFSTRPESGIASWRCVKFSNTLIGWVAGLGGLARTEDGGKTWKVQIHDEHFVGLVVHQLQLWAVGNNRNNYCSQDFGQSWDKCSSK